jgi:transcriptional regulator with XRE-family HTH domain
MSAAAQQRSPAKSPALEVLGGNVVVARARARISQVELAERSGLSRATISKIENGSGDVNVGSLELLANALGCSIADLFAFDSEDIVDDRELGRRANLSDDAFIDARELLDAVEEAGGRDRRYSRAGRPRVAR